MAISYPLAMPWGPAFRDSRFGLRSNTLVNASLFNGVEQVVERAGARWWGDFTLPPMKRDRAALWCAWRVALRGRRGTFLAYDPDARRPRGTITGSPLVMGGSQTGNSLAIDGLGNNLANVLQPGDYVSVALPSQRLYMVVEAASTNGSGQATLAIEPALRESPIDNAAVTYLNPQGVFRMLSDEAAWSADHLSVFGISFAFTEAL